MAGGMAAEGSPPPQLIYSKAAPPLAVLAATSLTQAQIEVKVDEKLGKEAAPVLNFPSGCGQLMQMRLHVMVLHAVHSPSLRP